MIERILDLMEKNGVKANKLTSDLGMGMSSITDWKKGKANPSYGALVKIAEYFNVSVEYLEGKTNDTASHDKLIDIYFRGIGVWSSNEFLSDTERANAKRHFAELLFRYKDCMNVYCNAKINSQNTSLSKQVESLAVWISMLPEYIAGTEQVDSSLNSKLKKTAAEKFSDDLKQIFIDTGDIKPGEEMSDGLKEYVTGLVRFAVAKAKRSDDT